MTSMSLERQKASMNCSDSREARAMKKYLKPMMYQPTTDIRASRPITHITTMEAPATRSHRLCCLAAAPRLRIKKSFILYGYAHAGGCGGGRTPARPPGILGKNNCKA